MCITTSFYHLKAVDMAKRANSTNKKSVNGKRVVRRAWTKDDDRTLKAHSKGRTPVFKISKEMKRTMGAVRQRAFGLGFPLGHQR
jgi:hypothetical protein